MVRVIHYTRSDVLAALGRGRAEGRNIRELVCQIEANDPTRGRALPLAAHERAVRKLVEELRHEGHPVCATPADGYFLAETAAELEETCAFLRSRAMTSLVQIARLRKLALPEYLGQLALELARTGKEDACACG